MPHTPKIPVKVRASADRNVPRKIVDLFEKSGVDDVGSASILSGCSRVLNGKFCVFYERLQAAKAAVELNAVTARG